jgi:hypothetical protein
LVLAVSSFTLEPMMMGATEQDQILERERVAALVDWYDMVHLQSSGACSVCALRSVPVSRARTIFLIFCQRAWER